MDKMKLAQWGEKLKTGGAQMSRMVSGKMKEILQGPTPESKMVDEATLETLEEPNWGMNMRVCSMINSEQFDGAEIVRAVKKKISGKNAVSQRLSLDLLEACTVNCEKVASEVASEKVLEDMVKMIENPQTHPGNRNRALQLIRAWGQSEDLAYLPVFRQTYMSLKEQSTQLPMDADDGNAPLYQTLESYMGEPLPPPENYPVNNTGLQGNDFAYNYGSFYVEQKKELFEVTRNSLELLSSILSTGTEPKPPKDDLTESMLEKCKQSQLAIQMIIESTTDDDGTLFEALNLNDELQQVISKFEVLETGSKVDTTAVIPTAHAETDIESTLDASPSNHNETKTIASPSTHNETQMNASRKAGGIEPGSDAKVSNENEESERV
ncbi:phytochrome A-associated F-box protein-like [Hibiscus syriacus]|uniref:Phytochrome A-associated F-box protein-like n=1 Tax=Hibiscus syriacus TaxID=106335 RepID=A0A6A2Z2R4_HIBSY|nr:TOM1-like protein 2 [Hibiscus syriacus]XP_039021206.1 TOM1-like protein 2 [Hibiscus syriacus]XP_039021207.1 TOM1-like protein 2 [Hibiscus syriacus]KAE8685352.1 phytochrome A-associated F-box protein-like [Hibiscus syriacus]